MPTTGILTDKPDENLEIKESQKSKVTNVSQNKMVRTDCSEQKIDKFLNTTGSNNMLMSSKSKTADVITR